MRFKTVGLIASLSFLLFACGEKQATEAPAPPAPDVSVVETKAQDVPLFLEFVGQTGGLKDIAIRARVEGFLEGLHFQEGARSKKATCFTPWRANPSKKR
jgi:membrane fusion protein (multidrug efflux system)